ncbi:MAG TPA: thiamine diphosphokinase [Spirochaetaceae bacterium]|jgi:thiamine pyrophosphokinase|nr:thiamine diphosphokinase [Spirochaetaceae bacterium]
MLVSMDTALLVTGGDAPAFSVLRSRMGSFAYICAADSGLDTLRAWGVRPDLVVGDFDSIADPSVLKDYAQVIGHPRDKDDTDTELGLSELRARGYKRVVVAGGGGGRLDHSLAIRALFEREDGPDEWYTAAERCVRIRGETRFATEPGALVSVFPLSGGSSGMDSSGLQWPLAGLVWDAGHFGVSNVALSHSVVIRPGDKPLLVVLAYEREA